MTLAAVLAGGASRRMGRSKAGVPLAGQPLIEHPIAAAEAAGLEPVVIAKRATELPSLRCPILREPAEPRHPLGGIVAALDFAEAPVVVVACDMPFVPAPLLAHLAALGPAAAVEAGGRLQPLLARYGRADRDALAAAAAAGLPSRDALLGLAPHVIGADELAGFGDPEWIAFNVNSPADLRRAEARLLR
jgi:molybdenum cofactor guanylyltransferase